MPGTKKWWQRTWFGGNKPADRTLGKLQVRNGDLRAAIDRETEAQRKKAMGSGKVTATGPKARATHASFTGRANDIRAAVSAARRR